MRKHTSLILVLLLPCAFAIGWLLRPPPREPLPAAQTPTQPVQERDRSEAPLGLLSRCMARVTRLEAGLATCGGARPDGARPDANGRGMPSVTACLRHPELRAALQRDVAPADGGVLGPNTGQEGRAAAEETQAAKKGFAAQFSRRVVGVNEEESVWLEKYMCIVHELRSRMIRELKEMLNSPEAEADTAAIEAMMVEARQERKIVLEDLQERLGEERYKRLRAVGGLGLMASALSCPDSL